MNILLLCDEYPPGRHGGIGTAVQLLAREYVQMGHKVVVAGFCHRGYGGEDVFEDMGVKVYRFRQILSSDFFINQDALVVRGVTLILQKIGLLDWDIRKSIKKYGNFLNDIISKYDIEVVEMPDYNDYMRFCKKTHYFPALKVPVIVKLHGSMTYFNSEAGIPTQPHIKDMERAVLYSAEAVASVSKYTAAKTAQYFSYNKNIDILYNGINLPQIAFNPPKTKGLVIFTGSLVEKKGIYQLARAWNEVIEKMPKAELHIYGKGSIDKIEALLTPVARKSVYFMGHVSREELYAKLSLAEVAVFPSYAETFGLGAVEAMACGTAVIFSTLTSGPEIVEDNITGRLVSPDDVSAMSTIIITLLTDEILCQRLATNGRNYVTEKFNINSIATQNLQFYQKIIYK